MSEKTYYEIFEEFLESIDIDRYSIKDWKPCVQPYHFKDISGAIIIWLKNGSKLIYIPVEG